jgi:hypothetical protein
VPFPQQIISRCREIIETHFNSLIDANWTIRCLDPLLYLGSETMADFALPEEVFVATSEHFARDNGVVRFEIPRLGSLWVGCLEVIEPTENHLVTAIRAPGAALNSR